MNVFRIALVVGTIALLTSSESQAQSLTQIEPDNGYAVQALVWNVKKNEKTGDFEATSKNYWRTAETFSTLKDAEKYEDFLLFLAINDWSKLMDELDFPYYVFVHGFDYRIVPLYSSEQRTVTKLR